LLKSKMAMLLTLPALALSLFSGSGTTHAAVSYSDLAAHWAPQIYQDVTSV